MSKRPNLLLFMPETVRGDAVVGDPQSRARTPNMDRLAEQGVSFSNCFAQMSYCSPSRCSMFTGLYPHTCGHRSLMHLLHADERNFFLDLKNAGYVNVAYGKNDLLAQDAIDICFDEVDLRVRPESGGMANPWPEGHKFRKSFYRGCRGTKECRDGDWACIQSALSFLDEDRDEPWCVYLPLSFAHPPYQVEEPFFSMHDRDSIPAPIPAELGGKRAFMQLLHPAHGCDRLDDADLREIKATYFGMVSRTDYQLGLLVDRLKERGLYENTVIVVFSDHGDYAGDYGMIEKFMSGFEDCLLKVPLILRVPGMGSAGQLPPLCEMTDLYPTLMDLLDLQPKHYHYGRSLAPLMRGERPEHRDVVFAEGGYHTDEKQFFPPIPKGSDYEEMAGIIRGDSRTVSKAAMARTERWKYAYCPGDRDELYDLQSDPAELINLADNDRHRSVREQMRERLMRWMLDTGDMLPLEQDPRGWHPRR